MIMSRYVLQYYGQEITAMIEWLKPYKPYYRSVYKDMCLVIVDEISPEELLIATLRFGRHIIFPLASNMFRYILMLDIDANEVNAAAIVNEFKSVMHQHNAFYCDIESATDVVQLYATSVAVLTEDDAQYIIKKFKPYVTDSRSVVGIDYS